MSNPSLEDHPAFPVYSSLNAGIFLSISGVPGLYTVEADSGRIGEVQQL